MGYVLCLSGRIVHIRFESFTVLEQFIADPDIKNLYNLYYILMETDEHFMIYSLFYYYY